MMPPARLNMLTEQLGNGQWVIDTLLPLFREALEAAVGKSGQALTALTMLRYRLVETPPPELIGGPEFLVEQRDDPATRSFWDRAAGHIKMDTRYRPAGEAESVSVRAALDFMNAADPNAYAALRCCIRHIVLLEGAPFGAKVHPWFFGCIFCHEHTLSTAPEEMSVTLMHELAHHELFLINLVDRLIALVADQDRRSVPWTSRKRPTIDRIHEAHAFFRTVRYQHLTGSESFHPAYLLGKAITTLPPQALTPFGAHLVHEIYQSQANFTIKRRL